MSDNQSELEQHINRVAGMIVKVIDGERFDVGISAMCNVIRDGIVGQMQDESHRTVAVTFLLRVSAEIAHATGMGIDQLHEVIDKTIQKGPTK